jgi:hypothetical protein
MPTRSRFGKSETREMVERDRLRAGSRFNEPTEWKMGNGTFFIAFVAIAAAITIAVLVLR